MKKIELNDVEKQFLRSLNTTELEELAGDPSKETSVEVPADLLGKLLDLAEVSLDDVKHSGQDMVRSESSSPWNTKLTPGSKGEEQLQVTDDAVAALQAFPIKTSFSLAPAEDAGAGQAKAAPAVKATPAEKKPRVAQTSSVEIAAVSEADMAAAAVASKPAAGGLPVVVGKVEPPAEAVSSAPAPSPAAAPKPKAGAAGLPKLTPQQMVSAQQTPDLSSAKTLPPNWDSSDLMAAMAQARALKEAEAEAEDSMDVSDASGSVVGVRQDELQNQAQASSFVKRLSRLFSRRKLSRFLGELEVFQELSSGAISQIAQRVEELQFRAGTPIIRQGDEADCMYILAEGEVTIPILDKKTHRQYSISLGPGQLFGEMALLTGERRFADVIAKTNCSCLVLRKQSVEELLQKLPEIARLLTSILGKRLMQSGEIQEVGGYKLLGQLGKGGMAYVFEAVHKRKDRVVAMKMLSHELVYQGDFAERFRMEAEVLASLRHPHIVDFISISEAYATFFLIMEKLNGLDLNQRIERSGAFSASETRDIIIQAAKALGYAHEHGIIHRDIKPSNIMFTDSGEVKVGDFGLAVQVQQDPSEEDGKPKKAIEGTPTYMAPEQILRRPLDRRVDIYALGIVAFKMLTGKPPFVGNLQDVLNAHVNTPMPSLQELIPSIPEDVAAFVRKATAKKPQHRFQDAREILEHFGVEARDVALPELGVRTLTFVYQPGKAQEVDAIISTCVRQAEAQEGVQLHVSS